MTIKSHILTGLFSAMVIIYFISIPQLYAQGASAEFITDIEPTSLPTGQEVKDGIQNVTFNNNILYVVNVWAGIQIIDVSDIYNPKEIGKLANEHRAHNFYIEGNYGYISDELAGVSIVDISNPRTPIRIGKIETDGDAFWVEARFPYVYVAEEEKGVHVYDITDMTNPVSISVFDTPGFAWGLALRGDYVYVADKTGGLQVLDFTDKNNPVRLSQFRDPGQAKDIFIEDNFLYLTNGPDGLYILDISNPRFPALVDKIVPEGFIFAVYKGGKYAYMANEAAHRIEIVNLTDPKNPQLEASYQAEDKCYGVWKEDVYVFVAANSKTLILRHNSPPVLAAIEPQVIDEQMLWAIQAEGYDPDGDAVFYTVKNLPEGAVFDSLSGTLTWTPTYEQSGIYENATIRIIERTASQLYAEQSFTITVNHVNRPPELPEVVDQQVHENETLTFELAEGSDPDIEDQGKLSYSMENSPEGSNFDPVTRVFSWKPTYEQSGTYVIDFIVSDPPGAVDRDACSIDVIHVDRKPVLQPLADQSINENQLLAFTIEGSDPDKEDQNSISYAAYNIPEGASFSPSDHTFTWTPDYDQSGNYQDILFIMTAGNLSDSVTTKITVNHVSRPPVLDDIALKMVDEMKTLRFSVSAADFDEEDQGQLTYSASNLPEGSRFNPDSLVFTWTPTYEQSGEYDNVSFTVTDNSGLTDTKTTRITVNHVNRQPVLEEISPKVIDENITLSFTVSGSDPDIEDQNQIQYSIRNLPEGAVFDGTTFTWTPDFDQSGIYEPEITISDGNLSDSKMTQITVNHVNRPPVIDMIEPQTVDENSLLTFTVIGTDPDVEDSGKLTLSAKQLPEGAEFDPVSGTFTWTPTFEQSGVYTITFTNTDPNGLTISQDVQVTVNHVNRSPIFNPITAQSIDENMVLSINIPPATDPDVEDEGKLVYNAENLPVGATFDPQTLTFSWTPDFTQSGNYTVDLTCTDGSFTVQQPMNITVNHVNRPPELALIEDKSIDENQTLTFTITSNDPDAEDENKLQLNATNLPDGATFDETNGTFSWTPTYDQAGIYSSIIVSVTDLQGMKVEQSFSITVNNVNRPPVLEPVNAITIAENTPVTQTIIGSDPDIEDVGKLSFSCDNLPPGAVIDAASGTVTWTPDYTQAGSHELNIGVTDVAGLSVQTVFPITVTNVNRPPTLEPVADQTVDENTLITLNLVGTDDDADDQLTYSSENLPEGAMLDEQSGVFSWTPTFEQSGSYNISATVTDGEAQTSLTFSIQVNHVNRPPELQIESTLQVDENALLSYTLIATDPDAEDKGDLSIQCDNLPAGATYDAPTATLTWTPGYKQAGSYSVSVIVTDGGGLSARSGLTISVINVNRKPVLNSIANQQIDENETLNFKLSASDEDSEDQLSFSVDGLPGGSTDQSTGDFSWTPDYDDAGEYSVTARASDGEDSDEKIFNVTVNNVNRPPSFSGNGSTTVMAGETAEINFNASDPDGDDLTYQSSGLPSGATLDAASGKFSWNTDPSEQGTYNFTVTVSDGSETSEASGSVTVNPPPPPPAPQN
jgi:hypothetical protein